MISIKPDIADSARYNIKETAALLKIDRKTLYNHSEQGLIRKRFHRSNNRPFFLGADIKRYWEASY